jgi:hypothetical protein
MEGIAESEEAKPMAALSIGDGLIWHPAIGRRGLA